MRICVVLPSLSKKGPVIVATTIANWLVRNNNTVDIYIVNDKVKEIELDDNIGVYKLGSDFFKRLSTYDIVHSHTFIPDLVVSLCALFYIKPKYVTTVHNYMLRDFKVDYGYFMARFLNATWPLLIRNLNKVYISNSQRAYLKRNYNVLEGSSKNTTIYNPVLTEARTDSNAELPDFIKSALLESKVIISVCSVLTKRKSIDTVIRALDLLPVNHVLVVIGSGPEQENLRVLTKDLNLDNRVFFTGFLREPHTILKKASVYIFPSTTEAFGLSGIEAGLLEVPIIASNIDTFLEIYGGGNAVFFDVLDYENLADKVLEVLGVQVDTDKVKRNFSDKFSVERIASEYYGFYNEL